MKKLRITAVAVLAISGIASWNYPTQADTFYGTLVPQPTAVTLSVADASIQIGLTTTLTAGGGDGTGSYRFNNVAPEFCSVTSGGTVSANYPGVCRFTVTRLATGKYLDATSSTVTVTALPEPDKSVISTPEPEPTPTPTVRATRTATPVVAPIATSAPRVSNDNEVRTSPVKAAVKKVSALRGELSSDSKNPGYVVNWKSDPNAVSYSVYIASSGYTSNQSTKTNTIDVTKLMPGTYTMQVTAIDASGKLSAPSNTTFTITPPKVVKQSATLTLASKTLTPSLVRTLDALCAGSTAGLPISVSIKYSKSSKKVGNLVQLQDAIKKYISDRKLNTPVTINLVASSGSSDAVYVSATAQKLNPYIFFKTS